METKASKSVAVWLFVLAGLVFFMTLLGGITRLTGSGLSMVQWAPLLGWLPPMGEEAWQVAFVHYQDSPEFREINAHLDLAGFQQIFWLEYLHRLLGRLIGVAFLVPFLYFWIRGRFVRAHVLRLLGMFLLGGAQGLMGWYMVKSGLVDVPHVSPYRLAAHLGLGVLIFAFILWVAMDFQAAHGTPSTPRPSLASPSSVWFATALTGVLFITVVSGAFVAGTHAGLAFNTFPLMDGDWFPEGYDTLRPMWRNFFENIAAIQWNHRLLALLTLVGIGLFWAIWGRKAPTRSLRTAAHMLFGMGLLQVGLGVATLLSMVPIPLASAHQAGAMLLFALLLFNVRQWRRHVVA